MSDGVGAAGNDGGRRAHAPRFSVLTTVFETEPEHLRACLESVEAQTERSWEHIVVDDASQRPEIRAILAEFDQRSSQRTVIIRSDNGGIVSASNDALAAATGEFVVLLDHDDVLTADALASMGEALGPDADVYYSDHDLLRVDGRAAVPMYKPAFSLERLRNQNYITHLVVARRSAIEAVGGFRAGFDGAQDHDLLLRLAEVSPPFVHVPKVLLHWRQAPASVASDSMNKPDAYQHGARAVAEHLARSGVHATVDFGAHPGVYRLRRDVRGQPKVSVIVLTDGRRRGVWGAERVLVHEAVASLLEGGARGLAGARGVGARGVGASTGLDIEVVAVLDEGTDSVVERGLRQIAGDQLVVVPVAAGAGDADKIDVGVGASSGDHILLLDQATELIAPGSLDEMVALAQDPSIGMVGAKLLFEDGRLAHGGMVVTKNGRSSAFHGWQGDHPGPYAVLGVERECSAVTTAAALIAREVFDAVGGAAGHPGADADLSDRTRAAGLRIIWTPHASWYHFVDPPTEIAGDLTSDVTGAAKGAVTGRDSLRSAVESAGADPALDPYYNPNLVAGRSDWLELPLRSGAPPYAILPDGRVAWA